MNQAHFGRKYGGFYMKYVDVVRYVNEILSQYEMDLTLRQIFYRLVANYEYPNTNSMYTQLSKQLVKARERGDVDESRMEDRSREFLGGDYGFDNPSEFVSYQIQRFLSSPRRYTRRMWISQPEFVLVWIEKDALSRVVSNIADNYNVKTAPSRGYASYSYIKDAIAILPEDKPTTILHFADHDPSGFDMTRDLQSRFEKYSELEDLDLDITIERVALTFDHVQRYSLAPNPTKREDPRSPQYLEEFGNQCWELDAIEPDELQALVLRTITNHIDAQTWNQTLEQQRRERQELEEQFSEIEQVLREHGYL